MKWIDDSAEQTAAVTDLILVFVAGGGIFFLHRTGWNESELLKVHIWSGAIGFIGVAAALGAVAHGFILSRRVHLRLWQALNMALALAVSLFVAGVVYDMWSPAASLRTLPLLLITGFGFYLVTLRFPGIFFIFTVYAVLALLFAFGAYTLLALHGALKGAGFMAAGVLISIVAAALQAKKSAVLTLIWKFDHNGIYHLVQAVGLLFLLDGLRRSLLGG